MAIEDELLAVGNKCSPVITRHEQRSSLDTTLQSPHSVTSQLIFRHSVGSTSLCEQLSVGAIVSGLAAGIYRLKKTLEMLFVHSFIYLFISTSV